MSGPDDTSLRVLVVDDDFMVAGIHTRFVDQTPGFRTVGTARGGEEALERIAELSPDLVLLDVHLPDVSGLEVLRRLRAGGDHVAVLMVTAAREASTVEAAVAGGAAHYLVKPFAYDDLRDRLQLVAERLRALRSARGDQADIDAVFSPGEPGGPGGPRTPPLPKGLSAETGAAVLAVLGGLAPDEDLSATECGERLGVSRVSARRYLEHFVSTGQLRVRLEYGRAGRPERRYGPV